MLGTASGEGSPTASGLDTVTRVVGTRWKRWIPAINSTLLVVTVLADARTLAGQDSASDVGRALLGVCGEVSATDGVITGTVLDQATDIPLPGATVMLTWGREGEQSPTTDVVLADEGGFFIFCSVPDGVEAEVSAEVMGVSDGPRTVTVEGGVLAIERFAIPLSDPATPGYLTGQIVDRTTGRGIANAQVVVPDLALVTLTNEHGLYYLQEIPYGIYMLEVEHVAYTKRALPVRVAGGITQNLTIELAEQTIEIGGIEVTVESKRFYLAREGLISRMNLGFGDFYTRADIERLSTSSFAELVARGPGVRVYNNGTALTIRGQVCVPLVFVDGMRWSLDDRLGLKDLSTFDADAVEFYKGPAAIPAEFNYSTNAEDQVNCGALVIWTRTGR